MKRINVVAAIIKRTEKGRSEIFATQRGYGAYKDWWEFPGGKIEEGETPESALKRELKEELNIEAEVLDHLTDVEYDYPEFHLNMKCYFAKVISGEITLNEHEASRWLSYDDLNDVKWLPADIEVVEMIKRTWL